jgi:hypothetical protein
MRTGSAISPLATTTSATCSAIRASWRARSRATAPDLDSTRYPTEAGSKMQDRRDSSSLRVLHLIILRFDNNSGGSVTRIGFQMFNPTPQAKSVE